jgi:hypothetical protein
MVRAVGLLRVAVGAGDRLAGRCRSSTFHPELAMGLIETSQSAQRALVMLAQAKQLLADRRRDRRATAERTYRREDN